MTTNPEDFLKFEFTSDEPEVGKKTWELDLTNHVVVGNTGFRFNNFLSQMSPNESIDIDFVNMDEPIHLKIKSKWKPVW